MTTKKQPSEKALDEASELMRGYCNERLEAKRIALALDAFAAEAVKVEREACIAAIRARGKE